MADKPTLSVPLVDELPAPNEKPKNKGGRPKGSKTKPKTDTAPPKTVTKSSLRDGIAGMYGFAGAALIFVNKEAANAAVVQADEIADAWIELCDQSPAVRRFWEQVTTGGAWGKVVTAHVPLAIALVPGGGNLLGGLIGGGGSSPAAAKRSQSQTAPPPPPTSPAPPPPPAPPFVQFVDGERVDGDEPATASAAFG